MIAELIILPQVLLAGWALAHKKAKATFAHKHRLEDAMMRRVRRYSIEGQQCETKDELVLQTIAAARDIFDCRNQIIFATENAGNRWEQTGESVLGQSDFAALQALADYGHPIRKPLHALPKAIAANAVAPIQDFMERHGINILVPITDNKGTHWIWTCHIVDQGTPPALNALGIWQAAIEGVLERSSLALAAFQLEAMEKDAESANQVLDVLLPEHPQGNQLGLQWSGKLNNQSEAGPQLFAAYPQKNGKLVVIFGEVHAQNLASIVLTSAVRGYCDSLIKTKANQTIGPQWLLEKLNTFLWRPLHPIGMSCVVAVFDRSQQSYQYAVSGKKVWVRARIQESGMEMTQTIGEGAVLGTNPSSTYSTTSEILSPEDHFLFLGSETQQSIPNLHENQEFRQHLNNSSTIGIADLHHWHNNLEQLIQSLGGHYHSSIIVRSE